MRNKSEITLREKICQSLDIPPDVLNGCTIEMRGRSEVLIGGLKKILIFNENQIRLMMQDFDIDIEGSELCCPSFSESKLLVCGIISSVSFAKSEGGDLK